MAIHQPAVFFFFLAVFFENSGWPQRTSGQRQFPRMHKKLKLCFSKGGESSIPKPQQHHQSYCTVIECTLVISNRISLNRNLISTLFSPPPIQAKPFSLSIVYLLVNTVGGMLFNKSCGFLCQVYVHKAPLPVFIPASLLD